MPFLRLQDVIFSPPLPMIIAIMIIIGMWVAGSILGKVFLVLPSQQQNTLCFVAVVAVTAAIVHLLAFVGVLGFWILRSLGAFFILSGISFFVQRIRRELFSGIKNRLNTLYSVSPLLDKISLILVFLTGMALLMMAFGAPTDADSLDYHLGVPLDWLRHGRAFPRMDWLHARTIGLGESINLLGLANGTDILGNLIQYSGMFVLWVALSSLAQSRSQKIFAALAIVSTPLMLFMATIQKPQLFPISALVLGVISVLSFLKKDFNKPVFILSSIGIFFAVSAKYSFLASGGISAIALLWVAFHFAFSVWGFIVLLASFMLFPFPVYLRNFMHYGDPLTPMLEQYKANPDASVIQFAQMLKNFGGGVHLETLWRLPFDLAFTLRPEWFTLVLGVGTFAFILILGIKKNKVSRTLLWCAGLMCFALLVMGQSTARYYLEAYFLSLAAVIAVELKEKTLQFLKSAFLLQGGLVMLAAFIGAFLIFPSALTATLRDKVMIKTAYGYAEAKWIDQVLPKDAIIIAHMRSNALIPRKFVDYHSASTRGRVKALIAEYKVSAVMIPYSEELGFWEGCVGAINETQTFYTATRNPFNAGSPFKRRLFTLDLSKEKCSL